jgi:dTDP-glucose 4,6-dehydratase
MSEYRPQNVLISGGAGFIGANFVRHLLATDPVVKIITLDLLTYAGSLSNLHDLPNADRHLFVRGDIRERGAVTRLLREHRIDTIVHFAAESHVDRSISGPDDFIQTNLVGTFSLLEAARQHWLDPANPERPDRVRFHHISTDEVFGTLKAGDPAFTETTPYAPNSPYSASKAGSDHLVRAYFHTYGLPVTTTNCSNNYGPYQHAEKFIPTVIRSCVEGKPIPVYGDGSNIRDWLYVDDHCRGIDTVLRCGALGETYNIGGGNEWANLAIVEKICASMDQRRPRDQPHRNLISFVTDRPGHDWRYAIDASRMRRELDWRPAETFETGIEKTIDWYLRNSSHSPP